MATLGPGAKCCGDPENCPIGVCDQVVPAPADPPTFYDLDHLVEVEEEEDDDE